MTSTVEKTPVFVSVDLDSAASHLQGYRMSPPHRDLLLGTAVPRLLTLLADAGIKATFFLVARDAELRPSWVTEILGEGHEIAGHSYTHPFGLSRLSAPRLRHEIVDARRVIEDATGRPVSGFRAPGWDVTARVLNCAAGGGYSYDASLLPTPYLIPARLLIAARARSWANLVEMPLWPLSLRRLPHVVDTPSGPIAEVPVSVTPRGRWPVYHTLRYRTDDAQFDRLVRGFAMRGEPLSYPLHAIDVVGADETSMDHRLVRHPGGHLAREIKEDLVRRTMALVSERFQPTTLAAAVGSAAGS